MSTSYDINPAAKFDAVDNSLKAQHQAAEAQKVRTEAEFSYSGSGRIRVGPQGTHEIAAASFNAAQTIGAGSNSVIHSGRSPTGTPRAAADLIPTDVVELPNGSTATVKSAEELGFIRRNATGQYENVETPPDHNKREEEEQVQDEGFDDPAVEQMLGSVMQNVDAGTQVKALMQIVETGEMDQTVLMRAADAAGLDPKHFRSVIQIVENAFDKQARAATVKMGIEDADEFFQWASENHKGRFAEARRRHAMERSTAHYKALASDFLAKRGSTNKAGTQRTIVEAGARTRLNERGEVMVMIPGTNLETTYQAAIRSGLLKPAR